MLGFDIAFYVGASFHALNQLYNVFRFDLFVLRNRSDPVAHDDATNFYLRRKKGPYKIAPAFCISMLTGIIGNLVTTYDTSLASALLALGLAVIGIPLNTKLIVAPSNTLKDSVQVGSLVNADTLRSMAIGHLVVLAYLSVQFVCIIVKF